MIKYENNEKCEIMSMILQFNDINCKSSVFNPEAALRSKAVSWRSFGPPNILLSTHTSWAGPTRCPRNTKLCSW